MASNKIKDYDEDEFQQAEHDSNPENLISISILRAYCLSWEHKIDSAAQKLTYNSKTLDSMMIDKTNREQQLAYELIAKTNKCLFITGKAGTGKTTFVQRIQQEINKNFLVLAPTGIAAIAVGGQTMHSFFGFPLEVLGPHTDFFVSDENELLLRHIDTIIIDEASMVRSDLVDGMDRYLQKAFHTHMPFGGKQVIFVGDLYQLPPVVKRGTVDDEMLCDLYGTGTPFFYKANVLKRMNLLKIEFQKIYRQTDADFIEILNKMRIGEIGDEELALLNSHVKSDDNVGDYSVILTAFNRMAEKINDTRLEKIDNEEFLYEGIKTGKFKSGDCPAPEKLKLKIGAQVIFCRNDYTSGCVNGTIAKVVNLDENTVQVQLENGHRVSVIRMKWESYERVYNRKSHKIESELVGSYTQFPLKLAWAITIHKSQGMTFDRMHFDLTWGTFAPGQAYVAISRMRSLEGLTLSSKLMQHHVIVNPEIRAFANSYNDVKMIKDELQSGRVVYKYLLSKNYDKACKTILREVIEKIKAQDYRNAALLAKQMFDVMLDDENLIGMTSAMNLIKDCNTTCNFLNAVMCLYGKRYGEAIGYADLVLSHRTCFEAMFIKARALYAMGRYDEAYDVNYQIISISKEGEEKKAIDKKQYLFEAKINDKIGNSNVAICKVLIRLCPECLMAYSLIRNEMIREGRSLPYNEGENEPVLIQKFNDSSVSEKEFYSILKGYDQSCEDFKHLKLSIFKLDS